MPTLYYHVEGSGVNILKIVTDEVVAGFLEELGLNLLFKDSVYIMSSFMASSQYSDNSNTPNLTKNRCDVEVDYVMDPAQVPWPVESPFNTPAYGLSMLHKGTHLPIFTDSKAGISIEQYTSPCALDTNWTLTFKTFDDATRAFDTLQSKYKGSLVSTPFDLAFSYPVSLSLYQFLHAVYKAKLDYQDKTLLDYINDDKRTQISFDVRKSQLTSPDADTELMIRCQQLRCLAQVTMDQKQPDVARIEKLPDTYSLTFSVNIQFGRPNLLAVNTPVVVDNTALPASLFSSITTRSHYTPEAKGVFTDLLCSEYMKRTQGNYYNANAIARLPEYDDWFCVDQQYLNYKYRPFAVICFTLDGPTTVLDLKNLDTISLHPIVQDILKQMGNRCFDYGGIFNLGVYAGNLRLGSNLINLNDDLELTITSNRLDQMYHLIISETTSLYKTSKDWDTLLLKYRYFFPLTIERNLQFLIDKRYFYIKTSDSFLNLVARLEFGGKLKSVLQSMVGLGEDTNQIYAYTQNPSQLTDYLVATSSSRQDYQLPTDTSPQSLLIQEYYTTKASVESRSLLVAFVEQCLYQGYMTLADVPDQFLTPNSAIYPYYSPASGGFYGFNTPLRTINNTIITVK